MGRGDLGFGGDLADFFPTSLPGLPIQPRDLRNNQESFYMCFLNSSNIPLYSLCLGLYSPFKGTLVPCILFPIFVVSYSFPLAEGLGYFRLQISNLRFEKKTPYTASSECLMEGV